MKVADKKILASAIISELQSSDIYLTIKARLFDLKANLNNVRVTEAFMDEIVENEDKYVCIPLCADVRGLISNSTIGHMYDSRTGEFHSTQIGGFRHFEKEVVGDNAYLVGYARVMKRNKAVCKALSELFADNALKFSFEISCGAYEQLDDGTMLIDVDPHNFLEGMAVVTFPACETATAQLLVAECLGKGDENMTDVKETVETVETEVVAEEVKSEETVSEINVTAKEVTVETASEKAAETETEESEVETASRIYVDQTHTEVDTVVTFDCDSGEEVFQKTETTVSVHTPVEVAETEVAEKEEPESEVDEEEETEEETEDETAACGKKKDECAEVEAAEAIDYAAIIAELRQTIESLKAEVDGLKANAEVNDSIVATASVNNDSIVNPFIAEMKVQSKYSLLETEKKNERHYSLLDRA